MLYNNTEYGFQILYPKDWIFVEGDTQPGDYQTDIVTFEPLGEKGKHYSKNFICGEVCLAVDTTSSLVGDATLQQFSDDSYNNLKEGGKSFKLLEYNTGSESKLGDKKGFEIDFQEKQGKRDISKNLWVFYS